MQRAGQRARDKYLDCLICLERSNSISKIKNFMIVTYDNMYDYYGYINQQ